MGYGRPRGRKKFLSLIFYVNCRRLPRTGGNCGRVVWLRMLENIPSFRLSRKKLRALCRQKLRALRHRLLPPGLPPRPLSASIGNAGGRAALLPPGSTQRSSPGASPHKGEDVGHGGSEPQEMCECRRASSGRGRRGHKGFRRRSIRIHLALVGAGVDGTRASGHQLAARPNPRRSSGPRPPRAFGGR